MDRHIKDILSRYVRKDKISDGYFTSKIQETWHEIMPKLVVDLTEKLVFRKGILTIYVQSAPLKHELFSNRESIKDRFNQHLAEIIVHEVLIR